MTVDKDPVRLERSAMLADLRQQLLAPVAVILGQGELLQEAARTRGLENILADLDRIVTAARDLHRLVDWRLGGEQSEALFAETDEEDAHRRLRHDLRTPINAIIGYSEMLLEGLADLDCQPLEAGLGALLAQTDQLLKQIDQIGGGDARRSGVGDNLGVDDLEAERRLLSHRLTREVDPGSLSREAALAQGRLVLVADDHPTNRDVLLRQLNLLGCAADVAKDGEAALSALAEARYGLLLTDCHMPRLDGFELARRIRGAEQASERHLPIIAVTGNLRREVVDRCLAAGMDDCICKPVHLEDLEKVLQVYLPGPPDRAPMAGKAQSGDSPEPPAKRAGDPPAGRHPQTAVAPVDLEAFTDLIGDDPEVIREMLFTFLVSCREVQRNIADAIESRDAKAAAAFGHELAGGARTAGAFALARQGKALEALRASTDWAEITAAQTAIERELRAVEAFVATLEPGETR